MHAFGVCLSQKHYHYYTNPTSVSQCVTTTTTKKISSIGIHVTNIQGHHLQATPSIVHTKYQPCSKPRWLATWMPSNTVQAEGT